MIGQHTVADTFAGIRPLVKGNSEDRHKTERHHKIFRPCPDIYVVLGGKYTTFRIMGREVTRNICLKNRISYNSDLSAGALRRHSVVGVSPSFDLTTEHIRRIIKTEEKFEHWKI